MGKRAIIGSVSDYLLLFKCIGFIAAESLLGIISRRNSFVLSAAYSEDKEKRTALRKVVDILRAGSVTEGMAADKQLNTDMGFSNCCCRAPTRDVGVVEEDGYWEEGEAAE